MSVFNVTLTTKAFKRLPDDSQVAVERIVFQQNGVVATSKEAAIAAATALASVGGTLDAEVVGSATVVVA